METIKTTRPWLTVLLCLCTLLVFFNPHLTELTIYNRQAVFTGELWRLLFAPLAHLSGGHLFWNLLVFAVFGGLVENVNRKIFLLLCGVTTAASGTTYLLFVPELEVYGGLSGLATGLTVYFALHKIQLDNGAKHLWQLLLALLLSKTVIEWATGSAIFASKGGTPLVVLPSAHLWGIATAFTIWSWKHFTRPRQSSENPGSSVL